VPPRAKIVFKRVVEQKPFLLSFWVLNFILKEKIEFQKRKLGIVKSIQKQIDKFTLTNEDLNFVTN
jgi:hypothetical protein